MKPQDRIKGIPRVFDEEAFRREWSIRGIGMLLPGDAMHGARCFHQWFVRPFAGQKRTPLSKVERFAGMALQGIMSNPELHREFWKDYESRSKEIGAQEAAMEIEKRIGYRAIRVAKAMVEQL